MRANRKALLAAGLIAGAAAMTGCTANTTPVATPTPQAEQQATAEPETAQPGAAEATMEPTDADTAAPIPLLAGGKEVSAGAAKEQGVLLLPLEETAGALGWQTDSQQTQEETQIRRVVTLEKDGSRITVSWTVSDNTARSITWQKDGLLIPVDARITTMADVVYVPAAFFEEAMDVTVSKTGDGVRVEPREPEDTPPTQEQAAGENG